MSEVVDLPPDVRAVADHLSQRAGLSFSGHRTAELATRLRRAVDASGAADAAAYVDVLRRDPPRFDALVEDLTIGETHFFREPAHLELLRGRILPELLRARSPDHRIQVWSAGCASGEEAYTLAIVLAEAGLADRARVLGTDISRAALQHAADATYRDWSLRGVDESRRRAYFLVEGDRLRLDERFTGVVAFRPLNLVTDPYPSTGGAGFDVIFCRNVLIYLTPRAAAAVVHRLVGALAEGGWLITASSDPHLGAIDGLETLVTREGVAYRRARSGGTSAAAATPRRHTVVRPSRNERRRPSDAEPAGSDTTDHLARARSLADVGRLEEALDVLGPSPAQSPQDAEQHHLRAVLLIESERWEEAAAAAAAAVYLDPELAVAEIVLGRAVLGRGDLAAAARTFRNARRLLASLPPDEPVPLADGASAGRLIAELDLLAATTVPGAER